MQVGAWGLSLQELVVLRSIWGGRKEGKCAFSAASISLPLHDIHQPHFPLLLYSSQDELEHNTPPHAVA